MRDHLNKDNLSSPARRHFLHVISAIAGAAVVDLLFQRQHQPSVRASDLAEDAVVPGCFLRGTHILTPHGPKHVESLSIGDHVKTARGEAMPIKWIGRQIFRRGTSSRWPDSVHPICVAPSALADNVPHAHLYLSPFHTLFIDGALIQVPLLSTAPQSPLPCRKASRTSSISTLSLRRTK